MVRRSGDRVVTHPEEARVVAPDAVVLQGRPPDVLYC